MPIVGKAVSRTQDTPDTIESYWSTTDGETAVLHHGDVNDVLSRMPPKSAQCVVTSPPYWGLRDYGYTARFPTEREASRWCSREADRLNREKNFGGKVRYLEGDVNLTPDGTYSGRVSIESRWGGDTWCALGGEDSPDCGAWSARHRAGKKPSDFRVLVACEYSGEVRRAFAALGFDAWSCDLDASEDDSPKHIRGDVLKRLGDGWDLVIAHPPCTYLTNNSTSIQGREGYWVNHAEAVEFFRLCLEAPAPHVAVENPIPRSQLVREVGKYSQIINPYEFGHKVQKRTCLWLRGLPDLIPDTDLEDETKSQDDRERFAQIWLPRTKDRGKKRSRTYTGIARAMARQWGNFLLGTSRAGFPLCGKCYVCHLVQVFRNVRRVLRDDGTVWLNLGDGYANALKSAVGKRSNTAHMSDLSYSRDRDFLPNRVHSIPSFSSGNLIGMPWRIALALQADGWTLRQDIIWSKKSCMPESVRNRCTKSHEYVFLLTKSMNYYCDMEAIKERTLNPRENVQGDWEARKESGHPARYGMKSAKAVDGITMPHLANGTGKRNKRSVWSIDDHLALLQWLRENHPEVAEEFIEESGYKSDVWRIPPRGYAGAHYATMPPKLAETCVKAGTSEKGACRACGAPWKRIVEEKKLKRERPNEYVKRNGQKGTGNSCGNTVAGVEVKTLGWEPTCECGGNDSPVPCVVLDPFCGSGTTVCVALSLGRRGVGIDLSEKYLTDNAIPRIEGELMSRPATARLVLREVRPLFNEDGEWID